VAGDATEPILRARRSGPRAEEGSMRDHARRRHTPAVVLALGLGFVPAAAAFAQDAVSAAQRAAEASRGPRDPVELAAFLDGLLAAQMRDKDVAGATVAVVRDGRVLLLRGFGWSDVAARKPVDPERTLFRIGSISKLFTWTAVMQLVEAGQLDLDADVNGYLDFAIPATYAEPITLRHILTHTPGFEEDARDLFGRDTTELAVLGEWLAANMPARVRPPGEFSSYSNYATALAGYIVERVSGMPFDEYAERRIFEPLGMRQATTRQPVPPALSPDMSHGYAYRAGRFESKGFEMVHAAPAGSASASAAAMARFMLAHLNDGELDGARILEPATARLMHGRAFAHDDRLNGFALGFYEKSSHGVHAIGHGGDTQWFHSDMALFPDEGLGVFVSYNSQRGGEVSFGPFLEAFLDHYYPTPAEPVVLDDAAKAEASRFAGEYRFNRRSHTTFQKVVELAQPIRLAADEGALLLNSPFGVWRFVPVGPLLYRQELGQQLLAFRTDARGRVTHGFLGMAPMMALERVPPHESPRLHQILLALGLFVFLATVVAAARRGLRSLGRRPPPDAAGLTGRWLIVAAAAFNLVFVVLLAVLARDVWALLSGPATVLRIALGLPVLAVLFTLGAAATAVRHWRRGAGSLGARLRYSSVVVVAVLFAWSLHTFNLLGWRM
jgi:CubicO group peptidase (beta-lactamase class C family)